MPAKAWELPLDPTLFHEGYNPFEVDNVIGNRYWINYAKDNMANYFRRRGLVFVDGHHLESVETASDLAGPLPRSVNFFSEIHWLPLFQEFQLQVAPSCAVPLLLVIPGLTMSSTNPDLKSSRITSSSLAISICIPAASGVLSTRFCLR
jgi:hypothetical protein